LPKLRAGSELRPDIRKTWDNKLAVSKQSNQNN
jgi:hypothetical protein